MIIIIIFNADDYLYVIMMMLLCGCVKTSITIFMQANAPSLAPQIINVFPLACEQKQYIYSSSSHRSNLLILGQCAMREQKLYENVFSLTIKHSFVVLWFLFISIFISFFFRFVPSNGVGDDTAHSSVFRFAKKNVERRSI